MTPSAIKLFHTLALKTAQTACLVPGPGQLENPASHGSQSKKDTMVRESQHLLHTVRSISMAESSGMWHGWPAQPSDVSPRLHCRSTLLEQHGQKHNRDRREGQTAAMQCNALPQSWATPDRTRSPGDNVHFHSCSGRMSRAQAPGVICLRSHPEAMDSEELAARQHSACHAGPSGRVRTC